MAIKLTARDTGDLDLAEFRDQLAHAKALRHAQASASPPVDEPWCYFDLAELHLYAGDKPGFLGWLERGIAPPTLRWQIKTFRNALRESLVESGIELRGLAKGLSLLDRAIAEGNGK